MICQCCLGTGWVTRRLAVQDDPQHVRLEAEACPCTAFTSTAFSLPPVFDAAQLEDASGNACASPS